MKQVLKFGSNEIEKKKFHSSKNPVGIDDVNIDKIMISDASACGKNDEKITTIKHQALTND